MTSRVVTDARPPAADGPLFERLGDPRLHALMQRVSSAAAAELLRPQAQTVATDLLERTLPRGEGELMRDFAVPFTVIVLGRIAGMPPQERPRLRGWCSVLAAGKAGPSALEPVLRDMAVTMRRLAVQSPADSCPLLEMPAQRGQQEPGLSDEELAALMQLLILAGHESTLHLFGHGVLRLLRERGTLAWLMRDPESRIRLALQDLLGDDFAWRVATPLARMEAEVMLASLLRRAPDLRLAVAAEALAWQADPWGRRPVRLPMSFAIGCCRPGTA